MRKIAVFMCVFLGAVVLTPMDGYGRAVEVTDCTPQQGAAAPIVNCRSPLSCGDRSKEPVNRVFEVDGGSCVTLSSCESCADGYVKKSSMQLGGNYSCSIGDFSVEIFHCIEEPIQCKKGDYYSGTDKKCVSCKQGHYCGGGSFSKTGFDQGLVPCPAGTYGATTGLTSETCSGKCAAGTYSPAGATQCTACSVGTFSAGGTGSCTSCPMGKYADKEGQSSCTSCPAGTYGATTGLTSATCSGKCLAGTYSPAGATKCTDCAAGTYSDKDGQSSCTPCPVGTYSSAVRATKCTDCDAGPKGATPTTSGTGKTSVTDCYISSDAKWTFENNKGGGTRAFSSKCYHK